MSHYTGLHWRCGGCIETLVHRIRELADSGLVVVEIAKRLKMSHQAVVSWCTRAEIRVRKPAKNNRVMGIGQKPAQVMPSSKALGLASIWSVAGQSGHASTLPG